MAGQSAPDRSFIGREEVVGALYRRFEELRGGAPAVTLVVGDTGVGKSTLVAELVRDMRASMVRVLVGRAPPIDAPPPFSLLQSAIESAHGDPLLRADADPRMGGDPTLIGFVPALDDMADRTPIGLEARLLDLLGAGEAEGARSREALLTEIAERMLEFTRHGPTALVLEDVHHADPPSLAAVEFFAGELAHRPLWILATARSPAALASAGREQLERFEQATRAQRIVLRPWTSDETAEYLRKVDPSRKLSPEEITRRFSEAGGNPYLLQQLDQRAPLTDEEGSVRRGAPIEPEVQQVLDLACVLGPEFSFALLLAASQVDEERLAEAVDVLVGAGLLFERPGEVLGFPEERFREEAHQRLPEPYRRSLHRRVGAALEAEGRNDPATIYALARHFYHAREGEKSVRYNRQAAEIAERALAPDTAWEHYLRALESHRQFAPEALDDEAELVLAVSRVMEELGVLKESEEVLQEFLGRTEADPHLSAGRRATVEVFLCEVLSSEGNLPATAALAQKVLATPGLDDQLLVRVGALHHLGMVRYYEGRYPEALVHHTQEVELARGLGNFPVLVRAQMWRALDLENMGDIEQAVAEARALTAARDRLGSVRESAEAHVDFADALADARRSTPEERAEALAEYATGIRYAEQAKDPRRVGWALYKTAEILCYTGKFDEAAEKAERALSILRQVGDHVAVANALKARGRAALGRGDRARAESDLENALAILQQTANFLEEIDAHLRLAQFALAGGDRERAREHLAAMRKLELTRTRPDLRRELDDLERALGDDATSLGAATGPASGDGSQKAHPS